MTKKPPMTSTPRNPLLSGWSCGCDPAELYVCEEHKALGRTVKDLFRLAVQDLKTIAEQGVRRYAKAKTPHVPEAVLETVVQALGSISMDEAFAALDKEEALALESGPPPIPLLEIRHLDHVALLVSQNIKRLQEIEEILKGMQRRIPKG